MRSRSNALAAAALATLLTCGWSAAAAHAQNQPGSDSPSQAETAIRPQHAPEVAPGRRPLMELLDSVGLAQPIESAGFNIYGHVQGSYTWNFDKPDSDINAFRIFDFEHDEPNLNQLDFTVERAVDYRADKFDVGGRVEFLYGSDAGLIHSNGLFDWYDGPRDPENQWDLLQAYVDVTLPVGTGLRIRAGKFVNFVGYETINPTTSGIVDFYSRSLIFFQYPFTHTGVIGTYDLSEDVTLTAGISRGDNQSTEDNNDMVSFLGSINWVLADQWALYLSNSTGPEQDDDDDNIRTTWDATLYYTPTERFTSAANVYFVFEEDGTIDDDGNVEDGMLFALSLLAAYDLSDALTLKGRVEWLHSEDNYRFGVDDIYEATVGLTIRPFPNDRWGRNLKIRPEVRYDYSPDDPFEGDSDQVTAAVDVVITF